MRSVALLVLLLAPILALSADERVVEAMSKATRITEAEIREHGQTGCASGVQLHMTICSLYHYYEKDVVLNDAYQKLMTKLQQQHSREELRASQRTWLAYRDAQCKFNTTVWAEGSSRPMFIASCLETMTEERTKWLNETLECTDRDCPEFKAE